MIRVVRKLLIFGKERLRELLAAEFYGTKCKMALPYSSGGIRGETTGGDDCDAFRIFT